VSEAAAEGICGSGRGGGDEGITEEDISDSLFFSLLVPVIEDSEFQDSRSLPGGFRRVPQLGLTGVCFR